MCYNTPIISLTSSTFIYIRFHDFSFLRVHFYKWWSKSRHHREQIYYFFKNKKIIFK
jgi:hypothetical protein